MRSVPAIRWFTDLFADLRFVLSILWRAAMRPPKTRGTTPLVRLENDPDAWEYRMTDAELREYGFAIRSRPRGGPSVWRLAGRDYERSEAVRAVKSGALQRKKAVRPDKGAASRD